jgi:hypothetical protein
MSGRGGAGLGDAKEEGGEGGDGFSSDGSVDSGLGGDFNEDDFDNKVDSWDRMGSSNSNAAADGGGGGSRGRQTMSRRGTSFNNGGGNVNGSRARQRSSTFNAPISTAEDSGKAVEDLLSGLGFGHAVHGVLVGRAENVSLLQGGGWGRECETH